MIKRKWSNVCLFIYIYVNEYSQTRIHYAVLRSFLFLLFFIRMTKRRIGLLLLHKSAKWFVALKVYGTLSSIENMLRKSEKREKIRHVCSILSTFHKWTLMMKTPKHIINQYIYRARKIPIFNTRFLMILSIV